MDPINVLLGITFKSCLFTSRELFIFFLETTSIPGESRQQHKLKDLKIKKKLEPISLHYKYNLFTLPQEKPSNLFHFQINSSNYLLACQIPLQCRKSGKDFRIPTAAILQKCWMCRHLMSFITWSGQVAKHNKYGGWTWVWPGGTK